MPHRRTGWFLAATVAVACPTVHAASIVVRLPAGSRPTAAAVTVAKDTTLNGPAKVAGDTVTVADAKPGAAYEVRVTLADGTVLQGVDLGWYSRVADKPDAGPLTDDDRQQMTDVRTKVLAFENRLDEVIVRGNHNRAVMLVDKRRDKAFHSDQGDAEVIWRPELWYFQDSHGGWEKVMQTDRVLRRERFANAAAYHAVVDHLRWVPELGGLKVRPGGPDVVVALPVAAGVPATQPTGK